jgi:lysophospholipase L1-like esterase
VATLAFLARRKRLSVTSLFMAVTTYFGLAAAAGLTFGVYRAFLSNRCATRRPDEEEMAWRTAEVVRVREDIRRTYGERPAGITRILVVGSSQTWGAGAAREDDTFVRRTEELLNSDGNLYQCINAGISGSYSRELLEIYREEWLALEPNIVVIDLSTNDEDGAAFAAALDQFATIDEEHGIDTILVLEPNSTEAAARSLRFHPTMRAVGARHYIVVLDLQEYLEEHKDSGILWWDLVHPTSYGHQLIANKLAPAILGCAARPH